MSIAEPTRIAAIASEFSAGLFGNPVAHVSVLSWNVRHAGPFVVGGDGRLPSLLSQIRPDVAILAECPRFEFPRGPIEPTAAFPYRIVAPPGHGDLRLVLAYNVERVRLRGPLRPLGYLQPQPSFHANLALTDAGARASADIDLVGVHFLQPSQINRPGRQAHSAALAAWIADRAGKVDTDLLVAGDFSSPAYDEDLDSLAALERRGTVNMLAPSGGSELGLLLGQVRRQPLPEYMDGARFLDFKEWLSFRHVQAGGAAGRRTRPLSDLGVDPSDFGGAVAERLKTGTSCTRYLPRMDVVFLPEYGAR